MPKNTESPKTIVVAGDVTVDWNVACLGAGRSEGPLVWNASDTAHITPQLGGAAMLGEIIAEAVKSLPAGLRSGVKSYRPQPRISDVGPSSGQYHHSYSLWSPHNTSGGKSGDSVWRVTSYLGLDRMESGADTQHLAPKNAPASADIVVLDDANLGFRENRNLWPKAVTGRGKPGWAIVKMASPVVEGALLEHLTGKMGERVIAVMTVDDLRRTKAHVSRERSWERTAQDLFWELTNSSSVSLLTKCAHLVVSLGTAGAVWISAPTDKTRRCTLLFDPDSFEGQWDERYPGGMIGFTNCLVAGLCRQLMIEWGEKSFDLGQGIQSGVAAMRALMECGYGRCQVDGTTQWPGFPTSVVAGALGGDGDGGPLAQCEVKDPMRVPDSHARSDSRAPHTRLWSILDDQCTRAGTTLYRTAMSVAVNGISPALDGVPLGRFGHLTTADRREIEAYRSIRGMLADYCRGEGDKPISIAIFGPPGSGKSFGVKQVAKSIAGDIGTMTFNLSQFDSPEDLIDAFHQVRDVGLSGKTPLVFWDEFDSSRGDSEYAWLRYFLAPMQDGEFQSGEITHHIGRAIFVFAGGTSPTMAQFADAVSTRKSEKGPDFVSRLKGYMDVLGPNPLNTQLPEVDPHYIIRRAIVLRSMMGMHAPHLFTKPKSRGRLKIDPGVLSAFLQISEYKHGVRSMESIITMSALWGRDSFERSSLPGQTQLDVHVDGLEFLALAQQPDFADPDVLEDAAERIHETYRKSVGAKAKGRPWNKPWRRLSPEAQEDNRNNVRDIPRKLAIVGLAMVPARGGHAPVGFSEADIEKMAEQEHMRWMKAKVADGWRYGAKRDEAKLTHPDLRPWRKLSGEELDALAPELAVAIKNTALPETEKKIDRDLSRCIREIARDLGYAIIELPSSFTEIEEN